MQVLVRGSVEGGQLATSHGQNRNAYTNAKGDFLASALREIGIEPPPISRLPE